MISYLLHCKIQENHKMAGVQLTKYLLGFKVQDGHSAVMHGKGADDKLIAALQDPKKPENGRGADDAVPAAFQGPGGPQCRHAWLPPDAEE